MAFTKPSQADITNASAISYADSAAAQDLSQFPNSYRPTASGQTTESEYQNTNYLTEQGTYLEISEIAGLIDRKAMYVVGKGFTASTFTKRLMNRWRGNGLDSANTIFYNAVRVYTAGGDFFAEIIKNKRRKPVNLKPLNPATVKVVANKFGAIDHYEIFPIQVNGVQDTVITKQPDEIFHLAYNRMADQIHGQSLIKKLMPIIEMRREAMQDLRVVFHRYVKPLWVFSVDTDDETEIKNFKTKVDNTIKKAENLIVPKGTVDSIERVSIPRFSSLDPLPWVRLLQSEFLKAEGIPAIVNGTGGGNSEGEAKIMYLAWQQIVEFNQMFLEEQILLQLGLKVEFEFPASIAPELIEDEKKDPGQDSMNVNPRRNTR